MKQVMLSSLYEASGLCCNIEDRLFNFFPHLNVNIEG